MHNSSFDEGSAEGDDDHTMMIDQTISGQFTGDTTFDQSSGEAFAGPARNYTPGDTVDSTYKLTSLLGQGGMGIVFACQHLSLKKDFAIKLLSREALTEKNWARFQTEAKALARLNHPGIVSIYNMGVDQGRHPYYVMDLLSGEGLDTAIKNHGPLPVGKVLSLFIQTADALATAHAQGIVHRDIKPSNLMLVRNRDGQIAGLKLVDFGIARSSLHGPHTQSQTATGTIFGTPYYMSPEQSQGRRADERSDIYSFGCTLFEALTGSPPFRGDNAFHTFMMHQNDPPPSLAQKNPAGNFPDDLEFAIKKMLAKAAPERYQKMEQVKHDLERIQAGKDTMATRTGSTLNAVRGKENHSTIQTIETLKAGTSTGGDTGTARSSPARLAILLMLSLLVAAGIYVVSEHLIKPGALPGTGKAASKSSHEMDDPSILLTNISDLRRAGCTDAEIAAMGKFDFSLELMDHDKADREFEKYLSGKLERHFHFLNKDRTALNFPANIVIGSVTFGDDKPVMAKGVVKVPKDKPICFNQSCAVMRRTQFIDLFGPDDLDGIQLVLDNPEKVMAKLRSWKRLRLLSFFNANLKAMPGCEKFDQSALSEKCLGELEYFPHLETLGLCGQALTGEMIAKMPIIRRIKSLRIKQIKDLNSLLNEMPTLDNLKEVWIIGQDFEDRQLESLTRMKNLESVRIRRSQLTPDSLKYFKQMPALKELWLDRNWTDEEKASFKKQLRFCQFESVVDGTYWTHLSDMDPDQGEEKGK